VSTLRSARRRLLAMATLAMLAAPACAAPPSATAQRAAPQAAATLETLEIVSSRGVVKFQVEVVADDSSREQGLMWRKSLAPDRGMLFDFKTPRHVAFWMKNTLIPLDMIFLQQDGTILSIAANAVPHDETPVPSGGPVTGVLEIPGGRAAELGLRPGDKVRHRIFRRG
jgi:uncharacterized membrane protein (UPF0127 family)